MSTLRDDLINNIKQTDAREMARLYEPSNQQSFQWSNT